MTARRRSPARAALSRPGDGARPPSRKDLGTALALLLGGVGFVVSLPVA
jgi:hypothetical protein